MSAPDDDAGWQKSKSQLKEEKRQRKRLAKLALEKRREDKLSFVQWVVQAEHSDNKENEPLNEKAVVQNCKQFASDDPFNPPNRVAGYQYKTSFGFGGSLGVTTVNGQPSRQNIAGVPCIRPPYNDFAARTLLTLEEAACDSMVFLPRLGAQLVTAFRYHNASGTTFVSFKTPQSPFLRDNPNSEHSVAKLLRTTLKLPISGVAIRYDKDKDNLAPALQRLWGKDVESVTGYLLGTWANSVSTSGSGSGFVPVYYTTTEGHVVPTPSGFACEPDLAQMDDTKCHMAIGPLPFTNDAMSTACAKVQELTLAANVRHRQQHGMPRARLEPGHFATEGYLLFVLDKLGHAVRREVYTVLPADYERCKQQYFDIDMEEKVRNAVASLVAGGTAITPKNLQQELGMSNKEWRPVGKTVLAYAKVVAAPVKRDIKGSSKSRVVVLVGLPGAGKSVFSKRLDGTGDDEKDEQAAKWVRINQDTLGNRKACERAFRECLQKGSNAIIDRTNIDVWQRGVWLGIASQHGVKDVLCVYLATPPDVCKTRVSVRTDHPNVPPRIESTAIVDRFVESFVPPMVEEGFAKVERVVTDSEWDAVLRQLRSIDNNDKPTE